VLGAKPSEFERLNQNVFLYEIDSKGRTTFILLLEGVCVITTNLTGSCVAGLKRENDLISKTAGSPEKYCNWRRGFHGRNHFRQLAFARTSDYC
jgi:hypothetical protein